MSQSRLPSLVVLSFVFLSSSIAQANPGPILERLMTLLMVLGPMAVFIGFVFYLTDTKRKKK